MSTKEIIEHIGYSELKEGKQPKRRNAKPLTFSDVRKAVLSGNELLDYFAQHGKLPVSR